MNSAQQLRHRLAASNETDCRILRVFRGARAVVAALLLSLPFAGSAQAEPAVDHIHFLVPGGAGGGWDGTARGVGEALRGAGLLGSASFQNMSGGGGGRAIAHLVETARRQQDTLMVNSIPIIVRSLRGTFAQSFRDLTPIAAVIGDYGAYVVTNDSDIQSFADVTSRITENPRSVKIAGGSVRGSMDHLVAAQTFQAMGVDPRRVVYIGYDGGGKAMAGLLTGETDLLVTGISETIEQHRAGQVRILAISAPERVPEIPDVPTLRELGVDVVFINWRGFFGPPGLSAEKQAVYAEMFRAMYETEAWATVRARNGWTNLFRSGPEFTAYLEEQETLLGALLVDLGLAPRR